MKNQKNKENKTDDNEKIDTSPCSQRTWFWYPQSLLTIFWLNRLLSTIFIEKLQLILQHFPQQPKNNTTFNAYAPNPGFPYSADDYAAYHELIHLSFRNRNRNCKIEK